MVHRIALVLLVFLAASSTALAEPAETRTLRTDVCVVGGGSGGIGAALAASRAGAKCILVEKMDLLGGTSTSAYVCHWGPGPGDEFAGEIYERLARLPNAVGITRDHNSDRACPWNIFEIGFDITSAPKCKGRFYPGSKRYCNRK